MRRSGLHALWRSVSFAFRQPPENVMGNGRSNPWEKARLLCHSNGLPEQNGIGPGLAFVCNQEKNYVVDILAPSIGTFTSQ
jgi:hypothetical protein